MLTYKPANEYRGDNMESWLMPQQNSSLPMNAFQSSFIYQSQSELKGQPFWGYLNTYSGGGYVANLGNTIKEAQYIIGKLENATWIDEFTRAVFIEFNCFNMNTNLFNMVVIVLELPSYGSSYHWVIL